MMDGGAISGSFGCSRHPGVERLRHSATFWALSPPWSWAVSPLRHFLGALAILELGGLDTPKLFRRSRNPRVGRSRHFETFSAFSQSWSWAVSPFRNFLGAVATLDLGGLATPRLSGLSPSRSWEISSL